MRKMRGSVMLIGDEIPLKVDRQSPSLESTAIVCVARAHPT